MKLLAALIVVLIVIFASTQNWRRSVKAVLWLVVLEGALRKWVLPQASELIYFLKDFVLFGAYLSYFGASLFRASASHPVKIKNGAITVLVFLSSCWCIFQAFNPDVGSLAVGLFGLKNYIFYLPLMWMLPNLFHSKEELYQFLRNYLLIIIPVGILGIVQFFSPFDSPINRYAWGEELGKAWVDTGEAIRVRATGTFAYVNNYTAYLIVCFALLIPMLSFPQTIVWRWATVLELCLVAGNMLMTGSRSPIFAAVLIVIGYATTKFLAKPKQAAKWLRQFVPLTLAVALVLAIFFRPAIAGFWQRVTANQDVSSRVSSSFLEPFKFAKLKELDGYGTGATHPGSKAIQSILGLPPLAHIPVYYEEEMGRIMLEIGPIGFVFWYSLRIALIVALGMAFRRTHHPFLASLILSAFMVHLVQLRAQLVVHHTFAVYYWFMAGFLFLIPRLDWLERYQQTQQPALRPHAQPSYLPSAPYRQS